MAEETTAQTPGSQTSEWRATLVALLTVPGLGAALITFKDALLVRPWPFVALAAIGAVLALGYAGLRTWLKAQLAKAAPPAALLLLLILPAPARAQEHHGTITAWRDAQGILRTEYALADEAPAAPPVRAPVVAPQLDQAAVSAATPPPAPPNIADLALCTAATLPAAAAKCAGQPPPPDYGRISFYSVISSAATVGLQLVGTYLTLRFDPGSPLGK